MSVVQIGSTVRLRGVASEDVLVIGDFPVAPGGPLSLSPATPLGRALLGHGAGEEIVVRTEAGDVRFRILGVWNGTA
jgi:transcription elongation GreA/GreB family factor